MKRRARRISVLRLVAGLALTFTITGCAGVSAGPIAAVLLLFAGLSLSLIGLDGTPRAEAGIACEGTVGQVCINGALVDACCPRGVACNFGRGLEICDDGSCAQYPERCAQPVPTPTPTPAPSACIGDCDGSGSVTVDELLTAVSILLESSSIGACPAADTDADGAVIVSEVVRAVGVALNGCPPECNGTWGQECRNGMLADACCPAGVICNFGRGVSVCEDGSCVNFPDTCAETCDGTWETACRDGALVRLCCPPGLACNFGLGLETCADGSCVNFPETCP